MKESTSLLGTVMLFGYVVAGVPVQSDLAQPENYELEINGASYDLGLDQEKELVSPSGERWKVKLSLKAIVEFADTFVRFRHRNSLGPSSSDLGDGVTQVMMASPLGTLVMVQEYANMDPYSLVDLMLQELTKEEVDYGYEYVEAPTKRVAGKKELRGKTATTSYRDDVWIREVLVFSGRDEGLIVVTMINRDEDFEAEKPILDEFWASLVIHL